MAEPPFSSRLLAEVLRGIFRVVRCGLRLPQNFAEEGARQELDLKVGICRFRVCSPGVDVGARVGHYEVIRAPPSSEQQSRQGFPCSAVFAVMCRSLTVWMI